MKRRAFFTLLIFIVSPLLAHAQPLADRVPDDALFYFGWSGADQPGAGFADSRLKSFLDASAVPQLVNDTLPKLLDAVVQKDPKAALFRDVVTKLLPDMWHYPTALYVGPVDGLNVLAPTPRLALICKAGAHSTQLKKEINGYLDQFLTNSQLPITAIEEEGFVAVMVGNVTLDLAAKTKVTLAYRKDFIDAMAQVGKDPMLAAYVDFQGITALIDQVATLAPQIAGQWQLIRETLGVAGLKRMAWTAGFDGREFATQGFVMAPAPRTGLLQLLDAGPLSDDVLRAIPQSATMVLAGKLDLSKLLTMARSIAGKINPSAPDAINAGLTMASMALGVNIEVDLINPIGDEWVAYNSPMIGGVGPLGFVIVNHARDAAKLEQSLTRLAALANSRINGDARKPHSYGFGDTPRAQIVDAQIDGLKVHYLNTPFISPAWTVKNGNLYIALYPQTVTAAANASNAKSILDNPDFTALRKRMGGEKASSLSFFDLPRSTPVGYPYILMGSRLLGFADMFGLQTPAAVLPSLEKLLPLMSPAGSAAWTDDAGMHTRSITPFPGATLFGGPEVILIEGNGLIAPILMPYLSKREAEMKAQRATPAATEQKP